MKRKKQKVLQWGEEFSVLKAGEGGIGQAQGMRLLRDAGIQCRAAYSPYVGHTGIQVLQGTSTNKVSKILWG